MAIVIGDTELASGLPLASMHRRKSKLGETILQGIARTRRGGRSGRSPPHTSRSFLKSLHRLKPVPPTAAKCLIKPCAPHQIIRSATGRHPAGRSARPLRRYKFSRSAHADRSKKSSAGYPRDPPKRSPCPAAESDTESETYW